MELWGLTGLIEVNEVYDVMFSDPMQSVIIIIFSILNAFYFYLHDWFVWFGDAFDLEMHLK